MVTVQGVTVEADTEKGLAYGAGGELEAKPDTTHGIDVVADSNVHCGRMAVTESGRHDYRFAKGVTARLIEDEAPHGPPGELSLNERHKWIVAEYLAGRRPSNKDNQKANRCSWATAARDLQTLRSLSLLKSGHRRQP